MSECQISIASQVSSELVEMFARLMPQLGTSSPAPDWDAIEAMLKPGGCVLFVARLAAESPIVGVLALATYRTPTGLHAWIEDVIVDEMVRGQGIGQALTQAAIEKAREMGAKEVNLTSRPAREAANRLYRRMGFQPWQTNLYRFPLPRQD